MKQGLILLILLLATPAHARRYTMLVNGVTFHCVARKPCPHCVAPIRPVCIARVRLDQVPALCGSPAGSFVR